MTTGPRDLPVDTIEKVKMMNKKQNAPYKLIKLILGVILEIIIKTPPIGLHLIRPTFNTPNLYFLLGTHTIILQVCAPSPANPRGQH